MVVVVIVVVVAVVVVVSVPPERTIQKPITVEIHSLPLAQEHFIPHSFLLLTPENRNRSLKTQNSLRIVFRVQVLRVFGKNRRYLLEMVTVCF